MNLKENCLNNKLILIAMNKFVQEAAAGLVSLEGSLATVCEQAQVNRTQVYERKKQIEDALETTGLALPGHPAPASRPTSEPALSEEGWRIRESVLRYRLNHPGALVLRERGYTTYSDDFIRYMLDLGDEWEGFLERFRPVRIA